jgi:hypothetical protein
MRFPAARQSRPRAPAGGGSGQRGVCGCPPWPRERTSGRRGPGGAPASRGPRARQAPGGCGGGLPSACQAAWPVCPAATQPDAKASPRRSQVACRVPPPDASAAACPWYLPPTPGDPPGGCLPAAPNPEPPRMPPRRAAASAADGLTPEPQVAGDGPLHRREPPRGDPRAPCPSRKGIRERPLPRIPADPPRTARRFPVSPARATSRGYPASHGRRSEGRGDRQQIMRRGRDEAVQVDRPRAQPGRGSPEGRGRGPGAGAPGGAGPSQGRPDGTRQARPCREMPPGAGVRPEILRPCPSRFPSRSARASPRGQQRRDRAQARARPVSRETSRPGRAGPGPDPAPLDRLGRPRGARAQGPGRAEAPLGGEAAGGGLLQPIADPARLCRRAGRLEPTPGERERPRRNRLAGGAGRARARDAAPQEGAGKAPSPRALRGARGRRAAHRNPGPGGGGGNSASLGRCRRQDRRLPAGMGPGAGPEAPPASPVRRPLRKAPAVFPKPR